MAPQLLPQGFEETRDATAQELDALPSISREAVHVLERCIAEHHVAEIDYTKADGIRELIEVRPAFIRTKTADHIVVWAYPIGVEHWIELRLDRIGGVRDTGEVFEPPWQ